MNTKAIPNCGPKTPLDQMYAMLEAEGCLVVRDLADSDAIRQVREELSRPFAQVTVDNDDPEAFYPGNTRRMPALMHRSKTARRLMMDPVVEQLGDRHLSKNSKNWQLNVSAALEIGPGSRDQILHREEDLYQFWEPPRPNLILASMWAISDFTAENGGTQIVPGSHVWPADRVPKPEEIVRAEMPSGSVLFWLGGTLHGGGANVTENEWRYGVILTYTLGWLRQEENQHLSMPLAEALALPAAMRSRMGFDQAYDGALGFYDESVLLGA